MFYFISFIYQWTDFRRKQSNRTKQPSWMIFLNDVGMLEWFECLDWWKGGGSEDSGCNGVNSDISYGIGLLVAKLTEFNTCCYL